ncbi:MAG: hypothetical protein ACTHOI_04085 [Sphingomicrobium sp.]
MEFFNYVMVLASVIVGLAVTHLLQGVAKLIQHPDAKKLYWVHLLWVALMFLNALFLWWWEYQLSSTKHWTFELYVFVISFSVVLYLICAVLMPSDLGDYASYRAYYYSRRRWLFGLLLLFSLMDLADSAIKGPAHLAELGWPYYAVVGTRSALLLAAMKTRNSKFHAFVALLFIIQLFVLAFRSFHTMQ